MEKIDDNPPVWLERAPLPEPKAVEAGEKVKQSSEDPDETDAPDMPCPDNPEEMIRSRAQKLNCPVAAYRVEGHRPDVWAGTLFFEVQDREPEPDMDLLVGLLDADGDWVPTRRASGRAQS